MAKVADPGEGIGASDASAYSGPMIHPTPAGGALGLCLLAFGVVWLIFSRRIASFWSVQTGVRVPSGGYYFLRYQLAPILVIVAGALLLLGVLRVM